MSKKIERECILCNKHFLKEPNEIRNSGGKFCSLHCARSYYRGEKATHWKGGKPKCKENGCNRLVSRGSTYCVHHAHTKERGGRNYKRGIPKCIDCGKQLHDYHSKRCKKCFGKTISGEKSYLWKGGISFYPYPQDWTNTLKESIRERDSYMCQICGIHKDELKQKLHIHHIDYDKENLDPKNLITLCIYCHMKTNGNRKYWINYFKEAI
jgi:hypothetical protein